MRRREFLQKGMLAAAGLVMSSDNLPISFASSKKEREELPLVVLEGTPRQRGRIHGETLRSKIREVTDIWKDSLHESTKMHPDAYIAEFMQNTHFVRAIEKWATELLEEVKGISEGSGLDLTTTLASQYADEEWWYQRNKSCGISLSEGKSCTALGVSANGGVPSLLGQNMDLSQWTDGYEVLFKIAHEDSPLESYVYTCAGSIAANGMNNHAVGICCNTLMQLDQCTDGLPVAFIVRKVLEQTTRQGAVRFIHEAKHASGQNYTIGGPDRVEAYECSANKIVRFVPYEDGSRVYHTNHPIVNDDQSIYTRLIQKCARKSGVDYLPNTVSRCKAMEIRLDDSSKVFSVAEMKEALSSHDDPENPVCRHGDSGYTAASMVYELSGSPVLHISPGPPCKTKYEVFRF